MRRSRSSDNHPSKRTIRKGILSVSGAVIGLLVLTGVAAAVETGESASIASGFNGTFIPGGSIVWFSSVIQPNGVSVNDKVHFVDQTLTFTAPNGTSWVVKVPGGEVSFDSPNQMASTSYNPSIYAWTTTVPAGYTQDIFISGIAYHVPAGGLQGGTHVTWAGEFLASESCLTKLNWKFAAAVYSTVGGAQTNNDGYDHLGVKPVDSPGPITIYDNSDHAGTPENFTWAHTQGAMGGGGANFTGSYSGTVGVGRCE